MQAVALGIKTLGLGRSSAGGGDGGGGDGGGGGGGGGDGAMSASAVGGSSSGSAPAAKLLPLKPTLSFAFNPEDSNTPITGIVPLPQSHYACISATSGQIRMYAVLCLLCAASFCVNIFKNNTYNTPARIRFDLVDGRLVLVFALDSVVRVTCLNACVIVYR